MKSLVGFAFAAALALAPQPAFAQHGGGGGGGHSGGGGGHSNGGGGGHSGVASGGGGTHVAASAASAKPSGTAVTAGRPAAAGNSSVVSTKFVGPGASTAAPAERFAAGNIVWSEPPGKSNPSSVAIPANSFHAESPNIPAPESRASAFAARTQPVSPLSANHFVRTPAMRTPATVQIPLMPHFGPIPLRNRNSQNFFFFPGGCFNGFFPGCGFGSGFFFGAPLFGFGFGYGYGYGAGYAYGSPGCDPDWGCSGYGNYGLSANPGGTPAASDQGGTPQQSFDDEKLSWQDPPIKTENANTPPNPATILYLTDGTSFSATNYWLAEGRLHYVTTYGGSNSIPAAQLDWQRTVNENAARGVAVTLRPTPEPETTSPAPPLPPPPDPAAPDTPQQQ